MPRLLGPRFSCPQEIFFLFFPSELFKGKGKGKGVEVVLEKAILNGWLVTTTVGLKIHFIQFHSENYMEKQLMEDFCLG